MSDDKPWSETMTKADVFEDTANTSSPNPRTLEPTHSVSLNEDFVETTIPNITNVPEKKEEKENTICLRRKLKTM